MLVKSNRIMGFDEQFSQDHCYFDEATVNQVAMNLEVTDSKKLSPHASCKLEDIAEPCIIIKIEDNISSVPVESCTEHSDLFLLEDEKLVKPGDKFDSHADFVEYLNENAKRWFFYYSCSDSRKPNTEYESYTYNCVYLRTKEKYVKKGLRKRIQNLKTDCPCKIKLRHLPNEKGLTVVYVCNHHDHTLSEEQFNKLQHGRRLPHYVKEEIMDLLSLDVNPKKIRQYVHLETGFNMSRPFFYGIERTMKERNIKRHVSEVRLKQLSEKMKVVGGIIDQNQESTTEDTMENESMSSLDDQTGVLSTDKSKTRRKRCIRRSPEKKRLKILKTMDETETELAGSQYVMADSENIQCAADGQQSVKCETITNPWIMESTGTAFLNGVLNSSEDDGAICIKIVEENSNNNPEVSVEYTNVEYLYNDSDQNTSSRNAQDITVSDINESIKTVFDENCIAYETVVTDATDSVVENNETIVDMNDQSVAYNYDLHDTENIETDCQNTEEIIEYVNSDGEIIDYVPEDDNDNVHSEETCNEIVSNRVNNTDNVFEHDPESCVKVIACDAAVQTSENLNTTTNTSRLVPVFDVYMKDGNVTGFVLDDEAMMNAKQDGKEKSIRNGEPSNSNTQPAEETTVDSKDAEPSVFIELTSKDTFTRHEYIHKYNLEEYMVLPHFPRYVETLAKEIHTDVLKMFTDIYREKAMFKMTTTQRGKEGNTTIWYITDSRLKRRNKGIDAQKRERLGRNLKDVLLLKDKVKTLKKENYELATRNKYLEDVAVRLVKLSQET